MFLLVLSVLLFGCGKQPDKMDVVGVYKRSYGDMQETLILKTDGTHLQNIIDDEGRQWGTNGTWDLEGYVVLLHNIYEIYDIEKKEAIKPPRFFNLTPCEWYSRELHRDYAPPWLKQAKTSSGAVTHSAPFLIN